MGHNGDKAVHSGGQSLLAKLSEMERTTTFQLSKVEKMTGQIEKHEKQIEEHKKEITLTRSEMPYYSIAIIAPTERCIGNYMNWIIRKSWSSVRIKIVLLLMIRADLKV